MEPELPLPCCKLMMQPKFRAEYAFSMAATGRTSPAQWPEAPLARLGQRPRQRDRHLAGFARGEQWKS